LRLVQMPRSRSRAVIFLVALDLLLLSVAWGMGRLVRGRQLQVAQAKRERDERGHAAAAEECVRIARELQTSSLTASA
jgi:hypothetical protein